MPSPREPWIKLKVGTGSSEKLAELPDDSARWGYIRLLLAAKTQRRMGVFVSRSHVEDVLGRHGAYLDAWLAAGLVHIAPGLCEGCAARHEADQLKPGEVVVHDYLLEQRDPTNAERQATFRKLQAALQALEAAGIPIPLTDNVTANVTLHAVTPPTEAAPALAPRPTPSPDPTVTADSVTPPPASDRGSSDVTPTVTPHSRARGTTVTVTEKETTTPSTTKKNGSDGAVSVANEARDPEPMHLPDPNRAGRPRASSTPAAAIRPPERFESLTPKWRTPPGPCRDYTRHASKHRLEGGEAVCDACMADLVTPPAVTPTTGSQEGFGLS